MGEGPGVGDSGVGDSSVGGSGVGDNLALARAEVLAAHLALRHRQPHPRHLVCFVLRVWHLVQETAAPRDTDRQPNPRHLPFRENFSQGSGFTVGNYLT